MKATPRGIIACLLLLAALSVILVSGCSSEPDESGGKEAADSSPAAEGQLSLEDQIETLLNRALTRVRYGDKSGLYDNEFDYLTDETGFDEYLTFGQVRFAEADTLTWVEVTHVDLYDHDYHDSAVVDVTVHFEGPTGKKHELDDRIVVYYYNGRWIKPTVSVISHQLEYEDVIRQADSAAAAEEEEAF